TWIISRFSPRIICLIFSAFFLEKAWVRTTIIGTWVWVFSFVSSLSHSISSGSILFEAVFIQYQMQWMASLISFVVSHLFIVSKTSFLTSSWTSLPSSKPLVS